MNHKLNGSWVLLVVGFFGIIFNYPSDPYFACALALAFASIK